MINENNLEIKFNDNSVVIRKVDQSGLPVCVRELDKENLSENEKVFINNIVSMSKSMTSDQNKKYGKRSNKPRD